MCIVVDANQAALFFARDSAAHEPVWAWLAADGCLVFGGRLAEELLQIAVARRVLLELVRAGRAVRADKEAVDAREAQIVRAQTCTSDDPHVIALCMVSGARTVCTLDGALSTDVRVLLRKPKGRVYRNETHGHLLVHSSGCPRKRRRKR